MRNAKRLFIILGILLWVALPAWGTVYGKIKGRVLAKDTGEPIPGVRISIHKLTGRAVSLSRAITNEKGEFEKEVPPGKYCVGFRVGAHLNYVDDPYNSEKLEKMGQCFYLEPGETKYIEKFMEVGNIVMGRVVIPYRPKKLPFVLCTWNSTLRGISLREGNSYEVKGLGKGEVKCRLIVNKMEYSKKLHFEGSNEIAVVDFNLFWIGETGIKIKVVDEKGELLDPSRTDIFIHGKYKDFNIRSNGGAGSEALFYVPEGKYEITVFVTDEKDENIEWEMDKDVLVEKGKIKNVVIVFSKAKSKKLSPDWWKKMKFKPKKARKKAPRKEKFDLETANVLTLGCGEDEETIDKIIKTVKNTILKNAVERIEKGCGGWDKPGRECVREYAKAEEIFRDRSDLI